VSEYVPEPDVRHDYDYWPRRLDVIIVNARYHLENDDFARLVDYTIRGVASLQAQMIDAEWNWGGVADENQKPPWGPMDEDDG
jgi:hypothetical protein